MLPSQSYVQNLLGPIEATLAKCVSDGWTRFQEIADRVPIGPGFARTRANLVWHFIADEACHSLSNIPDMLIRRTPHTVWFHYKGKVLFRFKKLDRDGFSKNFPTQQALAWHDPQAELLTDQAGHRLDIGYTLDPTESEIDDVRVICRNGGALEWQYCIESTNAGVVSIPGQTTRNQDTTPGVQVRVKNPGTRDEPQQETNKRKG